MLRRTLSVALAFTTLAFTSLTHSEVYRVVDAQGHVSFTNQKPFGTESKKAEEIQVHEGYVSKVRPTQTGSATYCGSIALPTRDVGSTTFYGTVVNNERLWRSEVARIQKLVSQGNRYTRPELSAYNNENLTKLAENQCAYDWAQEQRKNAKAERLALDRKSEGLSTYLKEMQTAQVSVCGEEPIYSSSDRFFDDKRKSYQRCMSDYQTKMRDIESDMKRADQQLLDIRKIETSI